VDREKRESSHELRIGRMDLHTTSIVREKDMSVPSVGNIVRIIVL